MQRGVWIGLGIGCGVYMLYTAWATYNALDTISTQHRLLNIGLIVAFGWIGGQCFKRASRPRG
jgi:hypothetical protein